MGHIKLSAAATDVSYNSSSRNPFDDVRPTLEQLPVEAVLPLPYDARRVALAALVIAETVDRTDAKGPLLEFARAGAFEPANVEMLAPAARAVLYLLSRRRAESAEHVEQLVEDALQLRTEMMRVLEYHLDRDRGIVAMLARMKSPDTLSLAQDLEKLADAYAAYHEVLANDRRRYRLDDNARARVFARALKETPPITFEHEDWTPWLQRAWTVLATCYADVCRASRYLFEEAESQRRFELLPQIPRSARSMSTWARTRRPSLPPRAMPSMPPRTAEGAQDFPPPSGSAVHRVAEPINSGVEELRIAPRYGVDLEVTLHSDSNFYMGLVENLSEGGVFVATHQRYKIGTMVDLSVTLPGSNQPLWIRGEVRWIREYKDSIDLPPGMGIRFVDLPSEDEKKVMAFLKQRTPIYFET